MLVGNNSDFHLSLERLINEINLSLAKVPPRHTSISSPSFQFSVPSFLVWANATVGELVDEMRPYGRKFKEIGIICDFMDSNLTWFERVYAFGRADIIKFLRAEGRNI